jgi:hypothetical protein
MTKKWMIIQNAVAALLLAWAVFFLYSFNVSAFSRLGAAMKEGVVKKTDVSFVKMASVYNVYYLCGILAGYAGIALLFEKKWGWLASLATSLIFLAFMLISVRDGLTDNAQNGFPTSYLIAAITFAVIFLLLIAKPFRARYRPTLLNWLAVALILVLVIVDKQVLGH